MTLVIDNRNFWLWFGGLWFAVGSLFLVTGVYTGVQRLDDARSLDARGRTVEGTVLTKSITTSSSSRSGANTAPTYELAFRFTTADGVVKGRAAMTRDAWDSLVEQGPVRVTYLPDQPSRHRVEGQAGAWVFPLIFTAVGGFFAVAGAFILLNATRQRQILQRIERDGVTTAATLYELRPSRVRINGIAQWLARYRYQDEYGRTHAGKQMLSPGEADAWKEGDRITVRYDGHRTDRSAWISRA